MRKLEPNKVFAHLDKVGEPEVRKRRAMGAYAGRKLALVDEWLEQKARALSNSASRDQIAVARDAAASTREIARQAKNANTLAKAAIIVAAISMAVAIIGLVLQLSSNQTP